jgi:hypothetical protein
VGGENAPVDREPVGLAGDRLEVGAEVESPTAVEIEVEARLEASGPCSLERIEDELESARGRGKRLVPDGGDELECRLCARPAARHDGDVEVAA